MNEYKSLTGKDETPTIRGGGRNSLTIKHNWDFIVIKQINNSKESGGQQPYQQDRIYDADGDAPAPNARGDLSLVPKVLIAKVGRTDEAKKIIKQNMKKGKDHTPFQAKKIEFEESDIMNTITCATQKDNLLMIKSNTNKGFEEAKEGDTINYTQPNSKTRRGRVGVGVAQTLDTQVNQATIIEGNIRRLTEVECERLQGFPDNWTKYGDYDGEVKEISRTQRYKLIGNAVTTDIVALIGRKLLNNE